VPQKIKIKIFSVWVSKQERTAISDQGGGFPIPVVGLTAPILKNYPLLSLLYPALKLTYFDLALSPFPGDEKPTYW
jgi:hypothetical protein